MCVLVFFFLFALIFVLCEKETTRDSLKLGKQGGGETLGRVRGRKRLGSKYIIYYMEQLKK